MSEFKIDGVDRIRDIKKYNQWII